MYFNERLFEFGMYWRIGYGVLRIIFGFALLKWINTPLADIVQNIMGHEIAEDPSDTLFTFINYFLNIHPVHITYFLAGYVFFWGFIDIVLSISLLKHKPWAFPLTLWLIGLFVCYELFRFTHTHSLVLLGVIGVDIIIMWLIYRESRKLQLEEPQKY